MMARLEELARHSSASHELTRLFLSQAHRAAVDTVAGWMRQAGLSVRLDAVGNLIGRREGAQPGLPALLIGSHLDTVRNAGKYDGALGIVAAIEAVRRLGDARLPFAIETIAFGDEEGVRFPATLTGSLAMAGALDPSVLSLADEEGVVLRDALAAFGGNPAAIDDAAYRAEDALGYLEVHIEQGPVLESEDLPLGVVTAIAGAERHRIDVKGIAGHAGTVPMVLRHDALTAAAEMVLEVERIARDTQGLVATVGQIAAMPGAVNVIPGGIRFSLDIRSSSDAVRRRAVERLFSAWQGIGAQRGVSLTQRKTYEQPAVPCAAELMAAFSSALTRVGLPVRRLPSGAGHDGLAMARLCPVGMLFVRCKGGISHNPDEAIEEADAEQAAAVLTDVLLHLDPGTLRGGRHERGEQR